MGLYWPICDVIKMKKTIILILNLILVFTLISCSSSKSIKNLGSEYYSLNIYKNNTEDLIFYLPIITNKEITSIIIEDVDDNQNDEIISYSLGDECQLEHKKNNYRVYSIPFTIKTSSEIKKINIKYIDFEIDGQKERFIPNAFNVTYFNTEKNYHISIRESIIINPVFPIIMSVNYYSSEDAIFNYLMNGLTNEKITKLDFDKSGMIES